MKTYRMPFIVYPRRIRLARLAPFGGQTILIGPRRVAIHVAMESRRGLLPTVQGKGLHEPHNAAVFLASCN